MGLTSVFILNLTPHATSVLPHVWQTPVVSVVVFIDFQALILELAHKLVRELCRDFKHSV